MNQNMEEAVIEIVWFAFNTLTEFCQGPCDANQSRMVNCNVCHEVNKVFKLEPSHLVDEALLFDVKSAVIDMLLSLLEGCRTRSRPMTILRTLSLETLRVTLNSIWQEIELFLGNWHAVDDSQEKALTFWFNGFILIYQLKALTNDSHLATLMHELRGYNLFTSMMGTIEIARGDVLEKVYFRKPMNALCLQKDDKLKLLRTVDRSSTNAKLLDFGSKSRELRYELQHQTRIRTFMNACIPTPKMANPITNRARQYNSIVYPLLIRIRSHAVQNIPTRGVSTLQDAALALALAVNVLYSYVHVHANIIARKDQHVHPTVASSFNLHQIQGNNALVAAHERLWLWLLIQALGLVILSASLGICILLAVVHYPPKVRRYKADAAVCYSRGPISEKLEWYVRGFWQLDFKTQSYYLYSLLLLPSSILGLMVSPLFFTFHFLIIIDKSEVVQNVIEAVTANGRSLLLTGLLGTILVYVFTAIGYESFPEDLTGEHREHCTTLMQCFFFSLVSGTRAGGGVGEMMTQHRWVWTFAWPLRVCLCVSTPLWAVGPEQQCH